MNPKRHIAFFLLLLVSFKTLVVPFVYLDFEFRKEYIIHHLCENRFKPQLHCDGKCYLAKQLHKVAEDNARQETQKQSDTVKKLLQEVFDKTTFTIPSLHLCYFTKVRPFFLQRAPQHGFLDRLILPPIVYWFRVHSNCTYNSFWGVMKFIFALIELGNQMKVKHILLCAGFIVAACSNPQKDQAEKLEKEVMMIHDAVMPKMGELISLESAISKRIAKLDSITQSNPTDTTSQSSLKKAFQLSSQLKKADEGMMDWMHRYKGDSLKKLAPEEAIKALTHEKIKIEQVSDDMLKSIEDAQKYLKQF